MGVVGQQDVWIAGARAYFMPTDDANRPLLDLGTISGSVTPSIDTTEVELVDGDGGIQQVIDSTVIRSDESYEVTVRNFGVDNRALFFLGTPTTFTQTADSKYACIGFADIGPMKNIKIVEGKTDDALATWLYHLKTVGAVYKAAGTSVGVSVVDVTDGSAGAGTIEIPGTSLGIAQGDKVVLVNNGAAGVYTVDTGGVSESGGNTTLTMVEAIASSTDTGKLYYGHTSLTLLNADDDYIVRNLKRGFLQLLSGGSGSVADDDEIVIVGTKDALSGSRLIRPRTRTKIQGKMILVWGRGASAQETVREFDCTLSPSSTNIDIADYSEMTFTATVNSDLTDSVEPAGRMLDHYGAIPTGPTS